MERALNRARTGPSSTQKYWDLLLAAVCPSSADLPAPPATEAQDVAPPPPPSDGAPTAPAAASVNAAACPEPLNTEPLNTEPLNTEHPNTEHLNTRIPEPLNTEQAANRSGTGLPGTNASPPAEPIDSRQTTATDPPPPPGDASPPEISSRPRAGWPAHSPPPTRAVL
jgi:hypothetical protein